jgi:hypothetical protein
MDKVKEAWYVQLKEAAKELVDELHRSSAWHPTRTTAAIGGVIRALDKLDPPPGPLEMDEEELREKGIWIASDERVWHLADSVYRDPDGFEWRWAGGYAGTEDGGWDPLMYTKGDPRSERALSEVIAEHGRLTTACEAYEWIGQSLQHCNDCGQPAWEHRGAKGARTDALPWGSKPVREPLRPWLGLMDEARQIWLAGGHVEIISEDDEPMLRMWSAEELNS